MGYSYIPSYTNFILFPIKMNGKEMLKKMADKGIGVRSFDIQNQTYCRVSIGTMEEMKMFTKGFAELS
jgi:histidinol-phosphate aminotransferase